MLKHEMFLDLLSNEGLFVKYNIIKWNFEWVMRNEFNMIIFENIIKLKNINEIDVMIILEHSNE